MTPGARLQAAIDCLDAIQGGAPAEKTLTNWARKSRFAGSKDRAAVRDLVFDTIRQKQSAAHVGGGDTGRALALGLCALQGFDATALFGAGGYAPEPLTPKEQAHWEGREARLAEAQELWNMPKDARKALHESHGDAGFAIARRLMERAPVDLRVNTGKTTVAKATEALRAAGVEIGALDFAPTALRVTMGARAVRQTQAFRDGLVELQDAGSQMLIDHLTAHMKDNPPRRVLDYCAGGGGKSLAMAAFWDATFVAHDIDPARMGDIPERARRAGVQIGTATLSDLQQSERFDVVLCDAPCSGSGSWRRAPEAKWAFSAGDLPRLANLQMDVLESARQFVTDGGVLAYATCSLFAKENRQLAQRFVQSYPSWTVKSEFQVTPMDGVDGFYIAILESR